jgi:HSP20 family protein
MTTLLGLGGDPFSTMERLLNSLTGGFGTEELPLLTSGLGGGEVPSGARRRARGGTTETGPWIPRTDVRESDKALIVQVEVPGVNKEDIKLSVDNNRLVIRAKKRSVKKEKEENWLLRERFAGKYYRALPLPFGVDDTTMGQIQANFSNGLLEVVIPKPAEMGAKKQLIDIKSVEAGEGERKLTKEEKKKKEKEEEKKKVEIGGGETGGVGIGEKQQQQATQEGGVFLKEEGGEQHKDTILQEISIGGGEKTQK